MRISFKYRLKPSKSQETILNKTLESCRWVYNETLSVRKKAWEENGKIVTRFDTIKMLPIFKKQIPELSQVYSQVFQDTCTRVDLAFQAFFRRVRAGDKPGYPRFKGYGRYNSFTYTQKGFKLSGNTLFLSKIGDVRIILHRPVSGRIKTLSVKRDSVGKWYACFSCEVEPSPLPPTDKVIGVDLGLKTFATLSNGKEIKRERWMKRDEKDIKRLHRKISRSKKGTPERNKAIHALRHAFQRQESRRDNFSHQVSRKLVNEYQFIVFENLDIPDILANDNKVINKNISDVAWGMFVKNTMYKAESAGRGCVLINPRNTTKQCSKCGQLVPKDLHTRIHECPYCGLVLGRDHNAAINILARGLMSVQSELVKAQSP